MQHVIKEAFRWTTVVLVGFYPTFRSDVTDKLDRWDIDYKIVKEVPHRPGAAGLYEFETGLIYFDEDEIGHNGVLIGTIAAHELIHKLRREAGLWTTHRLEEAIAVFGTREMTKVLGFYKARKATAIEFLDVLEGNGLERRLLSDAEVAVVNEGIQEALELARALIQRSK